MSDSVRPPRRQPARLCRPWDSPAKNTGVGCHFLLQCMKVKSESKVTQSCLTLSDPMDCSLPSSSVHGIFQARVLEWGAIAFSGILLHVCMCVCIYIYTHTHTHTHTHTYIFTGSWNGYLLQHSCLATSWTEEPGGLRTVCGVTRSQTQLSD